MPRPSPPADTGRRRGLIGFAVGLGTGALGVGLALAAGVGGLLPSPNRSPTGPGEGMDSLAHGLAGGGARGLSLALVALALGVLLARWHHARRGPTTTTTTPADAAAGRRAALARIGSPSPTPSQAKPGAEVANAEVANDDTAAGPVTPLADPTRDGTAAGANAFQTMVLNAVIGFLALDARSRPVFANPAMARLLGLTGTAPLFAAPEGLSAFLPDGKQSPLWPLTAQVQAGTLGEIQTRIEVLRADRGTGWMDVTARSLPWGTDRAVLLTFLDVTDLVLHERDLEFNRLDMEHRAAELIALAEDYNQERERAEQARREAEEQRRFLKALFSTIPNPLYYKDTRGNIRGCNAAFAELYGRRQEQEIVGLTAFDLAPADYARRTAELEADLLAQGGAISYERVFPTEHIREGSARDQHQDLPLSGDLCAAGETIRHLIYNKAVYTDAAGRPAGIVGIITDITQQKRLEDDLRRLATTDPLTGILNRRAFMEEARRHISRAQRHTEPLTLILADLDHFKRINDTFGHAGGDEVLKAFVAVLRAGLRESDTLGRMGGEEFAILLPRTPLDQGAILAERLRATLATTPLDVTPMDHSGDGSPIQPPNPDGGARFTTTVSMGLAALRFHGRTIDALLHAADAALYRAKNEGRNRVRTAPLPPNAKVDPPPDPSA